MRPTTTGYVWRFFRAGGFDQVRLDSGKDLLSIEQLDQKLWVALACPVDNVLFDKRTLTLVDTDCDRRIRAVELIAAVKWTVSLLNNPDDLLKCSESLSLDAINASEEEGKKIVAAARSALVALGKNESSDISVADTESLEKVLSERLHNGDGIITEDTAGNDTLIKDVIGKIITLFSGVSDRSGKTGINKEMVEKFLKLLDDYDKWFTVSEIDPTLQLFKTDITKAADAMLAVRDKINDYFARCAIARFDERTVEMLNGSDDEINTLSKGIIQSSANEVGKLPLSHISAESKLSLCRNVNPFWIEKIDEFHKRVVKPLIGEIEILTEDAWKKLLKSFEPVFVWINQKPVPSADFLDHENVKMFIKEDIGSKLFKLIELDTAEAASFEAIISLEKLVRFHRDIYHLCTNFVNFKVFYANGGPAIFQAGTLYLDQRSCNLCIKVDDISKHSMMAAMAGTYLIYCECKRKGGDEKQNIVAAFTNGDSENIIVGRNGVFYDRFGNDWDATIVKIIENPISLRQAFWLPYKGLVRMIESSVAKRAMAAEAESATRMSKTAVAAASIDKSAPAVPPPPPKKLDVGVVAAIGVAAGALGTFAATICGYAMGIVKLGPLAVIGALLALLLLVSGPSLILAYIKLRKRNLGPILDAGGWAINAKARINVPFGNILTQVSTLPPGAQRDLRDPYAEKKSPWPKVIVMVVLIYIAYAALNYLGFINDWTHGRMGIKKSQVETTIINK